MGTTFAPDARDDIPEVGPMMQTLPFGEIGNALSVAASAPLIAMISKGGKGYVVCALAVQSSNGMVMAIHQNFDAASARRAGAALIDCANQLDALAADAPTHVQ